MHIIKCSDNFYISMYLYMFYKKHPHMALEWNSGKLNKEWKDVLNVPDSHDIKQ